MARAVVLTEHDAAVIQRLIDRERGSVKNTQARPDTEGVVAHDYPSSDSYLAKAPAGGIPALTTSGADLRAGVAECEVYRVVPATTSGGHSLLKQVGETKVRVYNPSTAAVPGGAYPVVVKDKFGQWLVPPAGTAALIATVTAVSGSGLAAKYGLSKPKYVKADGTGLADVPNTTALCDGTVKWARYHAAPEGPAGTFYTLDIGDSVLCQPNTVDAGGHYSILCPAGVKKGVISRITGGTIAQSGTTCTFTPTTETVNVFGVGLKITTGA